MGCFSCFDTKEAEELNPVKEADDRKETQPPVSNGISRLPSGKLCSSAWSCE